MLPRDQSSLRRKRTAEARMTMKIAKKNRYREERRSKIEIYMDILCSISSNPERMTHIMYKANTSWIPLEAALKHLVSNGLIVEETEPFRTYRLTDKGFRTLNDWHKFVEAVLGEKYAVS